MGGNANASFSGDIYRSIDLCRDLLSAALALSCYWALSLQQLHFGAGGTRSNVASSQAHRIVHGLGGQICLELRSLSKHSLIEPRTSSDASTGPPDCWD